MNETLKNEFYINLYGENYDKKIKWYIKIIQKYEGKFKKDLKDFDIDETVELLSSINSFYDVSKTMSLLKKYREYNLVLGNKISDLDFNDERLSLEYYQKKTFKKTRFLSEDEYKDIVCKLNNEGTNISIYFKGILMCLYEGIKGLRINDILYLKLSDINDKKEAILHSDERKVVISDELYETLKVINDMEEYTKLSGQVNVLNNSIEENCIFKYSSSLRDTVQIQDILRKVYDRYMLYTFGINLKFPTIYKSGITNRFMNEFKDYINKDGKLMDDKKTEKMNSKLLELGYKGDYTHFLYQYRSMIIEYMKGRN